MVSVEEEDGEDEEDEEEVEDEEKEDEDKEADHWLNLMTALATLWSLHDIFPSK